MLAVDCTTVVPSTSSASTFAGLWRPPASQPHAVGSPKFRIHWVWALGRMSQPWRSLSKFSPAYPAVHELLATRIARMFVAEDIAQ
eukprot:4089913-Amphidinium_carterae.1